MASSLPCKDCFTGELTTALPIGIETTIHGLNAYVSAPPPTDGEKVAPKGIIVMIPDAFGWNMPNNRVLCDIYAKKGGYLVLLPDFMGGESIPQTHLNTMAELTTPSSWPHTLLSKPLLLLKALYSTIPSMYSIRSAIAKPRIISFFIALRKETLSQSSASTSTHGLQLQDLKIGVAGFCWGGQYAIYLSQGENEEKLIDCAFTAHPSFISIPGDVVKVKLPLGVCIGDSDLGISASGVKSLAGVLEGKEDCECVVLKDAKHGFALRSCVVDELQQGYSQVAEKQALDWFGKWLV